MATNRSARSCRASIRVAPAAGGWRCSSPTREATPSRTAATPVMERRRSAWSVPRGGTTVRTPRPPSGTTSCSGTSTRSTTTVNPPHCSIGSARTCHRTRAGRCAITTSSSTSDFDTAPGRCKRGRPAIQKTRSLSVSRGRPLLRRWILTISASSPQARVRSLRRGLRERISRWTWPARLDRHLRLSERLNPRKKTRLLGRVRRDRLGDSGDEHRFVRC